MTAFNEAMRPNLPHYYTWTHQHVMFGLPSSSSYLMELCRGHIDTLRVDIPCCCVQQSTTYTLLPTATATYRLPGVSSVPRCWGASCGSAGRSLSPGRCCGICPDLGTHEIVHSLIWTSLPLSLFLKTSMSSFRITGISPIDEQYSNFKLFERGEIKQRKRSKLILA